MIGKDSEAKRVKTEEMRAFIEESKGLERDYIGELQDGKRKGWLAAYVGWGFGFLGLCAGWAGLSQEAPPPTVFEVDKSNGGVEVMTVVKQQSASYGEVVDRYFLNKYVLNRESYDFDTLQALYDTVGLLSSGTVQTEYHQLFDGDKARDKVLSNRTRIVVNVRSITVNPLPPGSTVRTATVRFTTQAKSANVTEPVKHMIATIGYTYVTAPMSEHDRRVNPLGFQVTSYRIDPEVVSGSAGS